mgnify:CR=1 FL=1
MEYINHYTLLTGHMRKSYANEVEKEIRERMRKLIKFERNVSCNYTVPFMDGTKLHIISDGSFYAAAVMAEVKGEDVTLLTTVGCKDKSGLSLAMKSIKDAYKDLFGKELTGYEPKLPFIVDIPTPFCVLITDWSGDFCRTLAWSIFDYEDTHTEEEKTETNTIRRSVEGLLGVRKDNYKGLPEELKEYNYYFQDCGHSIMAIPECKLNKAIEDGNLDMFEVPFPVKYVLENGYKMYKNHVVCDAEYHPAFGLIIDEKWDEF